MRGVQTLVRRGKYGRGGRRRRSLLSYLSLGLAVAMAGSYYWYDTFGLSNSDKARVFSRYADLGLNPSKLERLPESPEPPRVKPDDAPWHTITRVVDGDSIEIDNGVRVRLIGIDAPEASENNEFWRDLGRLNGAGSKEELLALGRQASRRVKNFAAGKRCWLEYESERRDQYGRDLAYVHIEDGSILNELILARGYAKVYMSFNFKYKKRYIRIQISAMRNQRGFWSGVAEQNKGEF